MPHMPERPEAYNEGSTPYGPPLELWAIPQERDAYNKEYVGKERQLGRDSKTRVLLKRVELVDPFCRLSQDWENADVLPMWYAMFAWYHMQTFCHDRPERWNIFRDRFFAALKAIRDSDIEYTGSKSSQSGKESKSEEENLARAMAKSKSNEEVKRKSTKEVKQKHTKEVQQEANEEDIRNYVREAVREYYEGQIRGSVQQIAREILVGFYVPLLMKSCANLPNRYAPSSELSYVT
jgi:hypothetical protein